MLKTLSNGYVLHQWRDNVLGIHYNGSLTRYARSRVAHAPGMPGTFSPPPTSKETASLRSWHASRHVRLARAVMHAGIANLRWRGKRSRQSRFMRKPQFYVSGKKPMAKYRTVSWNFLTRIFTKSIKLYVVSFDMCYRQV